MADPTTLAYRLRAVAACVTDDPPWVYAPSHVLTETADALDKLATEVEVLRAERATESPERVAARAAYLAGDWDTLEAALGIRPLPVGPTRQVRGGVVLDPAADDERGRTDG
jgi:hypothetical protein